MTAVRGGPEYAEHEKINHRKTSAAGGDADSVAGMNTMYLDGHVSWHSSLPKVIYKGELTYHLPGDVKGSVGQIRFPALDWPKF